MSDFDELFRQTFLFLLTAIIVCCQIQLILYFCSSSGTQRCSVSHKQPLLPWAPGPTSNWCRM